MYKRNDLCPCGSNKKYKKCCINLNLTHRSLWERRASTLLDNHIDNEILVKTFFSIFDYSVKKEWKGACHAVSSILHVLLKEQGIDSRLNIGFVQSDKISFSFCHSWITINNLIYDIGLYRSQSPFPARPYVELSAPIFKSVNVDTGKKTSILFGVSTNRVDFNYRLLTTQSLGEYMDGWTGHKDGLWGDLIEIAKRLGISMDKDSLIKKYYDERFHKNTLAF